jgi:hypothetical protein
MNIFFETVAVGAGAIIIFVALVRLFVHTLVLGRKPPTSAIHPWIDRRKAGRRRHDERKWPK